MIRPFDLQIRDRKLSMLIDIEPGRLFSDQALTQYFDSGRCPEPELVHILFRALKLGDLAVDAGANVGFFTIIMSKLVGPTGKVIAIEPDSRNLAVLRKNLDINDCQNVEIVDQPLSVHDDARVPFVQSDENGQSHIASAIGEKGPLRHTISLATILGDRRAALLKMDIEGSEVDAIVGMSGWGEIPIVVSEVNPNALKLADSSPLELIELMRERGYCAYALHESGALASLIRIDQKIKITRPNTNMLFAAAKYIVDLWPEVEL